ncbi:MULTISPECIES: ADP-glyceromanno-heptose 6-epimerase [unclassified Lentimonas]|uniref:ADP-glyceromanno-heptose 6-epimerase n=1 Tax=unclassified Lentimonas TaxID=2630993 RepID=UPI001324858F|nr:MULTISPECIES: ADP-glyceromanno-heptose 6-epimerase [unclassified Lentimonas]CAA6691368.1 ADP-L-glycero-D-manno-heptose-6-epimerase (EC [Lentimonas sp. CC19]CAA6694926.1 ADP-L-glycero-D-manno-heptose-6-epimerase (EC [Lentimonas sp. CC10]CAA7071892.1 ADP-L-glycero-D-manno-heptose-6-epimerase (EC [Lentimonas sp. CC11]
MSTGKYTLVTGGAGFIGSALIHALNEAGNTNIVVSDILGTDEKFKNLVPLRYADYIEADDLIMLVEEDPDYFDQFDTFYHLGACSATTERDASYLIRNNYEYTKTLAGIAIEKDIRFVYASSAATYGDGSQGMDDTLEDLHTLTPLNMYGYSKHMFDCYAQRMGWDKKIVGLKYYNVYGPNEWHKDEMRSLVNKAFEQVQATGEIGLFKSYHPDYTDGNQMRDFLYVKDAVAMTIHLANTPTANGLFNLGTGEANTWNTLAEAIFAALDLEPNIKYIDMPEQLKGKYQYYTCANTDKLKATGYDTSVGFSLKDAVKDYVQNYLVTGKHLGQEG